MQHQLEPHPALALWDAGYRDLISIAPPGASIALASSLSHGNLGKAPAVRGFDGYWRGFPWANHETSRRDIERWVDDGASFGLRTRYFPTIDVDVVDEQLAGVARRALKQLLGEPLLERVGRAPKFAVIGRADVPFQKILLRLSRGGQTAGLIEVLGSGQQVVVHGTHPATMLPYTWSHGTRTGDASLLAERAPLSLPLITENSVRRFLLPALKDAFSEHGVALSLDGGGSAASKAAPDQLSLRAPSIADLRDAVACIPNDAQWSERSKWIGMGAAIRAAAGPQNVAEGREIWLDWCEKWTDGRADADEAARVWDTLKPLYRLGFDYIASHAREYGFETATLEFCATEFGDSGVVTSEAGADERAGDDSTSPVLPPQDERVAAIINDAERVFSRTLNTIDPGDALARWERLSLAARADDPLSRVFGSVVLPEAIALRSYADEEKRFAYLLRTELRDHARWVALSGESRSVLEQSAFTLLAPRSRLASSVERVPKLARPGGPVPAYLVSGLVPHGGLAALVAAPGCGKSFLALELAARVAQEPAVDGITGAPIPERFATCDVMHGRAFIFASEDVAGVNARSERWRKRYGRAEHLHVFEGVPPLSSMEQSIAFVRRALELTAGGEAPALRLVVIDLFRDAFDGDENSSEVVGTALQSARTIAQMFDTTVLLVHHAAHGAPDRGRGSSAFMGALDFCGVASMREREISLAVKKNKHGPAGDVFRWELDQEAVLRYGAAAVGGSASVNDACARAVADAVRSIAGARGVSRQDIVHALTNDRVDLFPEEMKRSTRETRISRGIKIAVQNGWVTEKRSRFVAGAESPPPELLAVGELVGELS